MHPVKTIRLAGLLMAMGLLAGIFSVAPAIDSPHYLAEAAGNADKVVLSAIFQFVMSLASMGTAILLYPAIKPFGSSLSVGYLSCRAIAAGLSISGTVQLLSILALSRQCGQNPSPAAVVLGSILKTWRDDVNHVFMVWVLSSGNGLLYTLLLRAKLIPRWLAVWGLTGVFLSICASGLLLFGKVSIPAWEYLALNAPAALHEIIFGGWLMLWGVSVTDKTGFR